MTASDLPLSHPARSLAPAERADYLLAVASIAHADRTVVAAEVEAVRELGVALEVPPQEIELVVEAAHGRPDRPRVEAILARQRAQDPGLGLSLLADAVLVALADERVTSSEACEVADVAARLGITTMQAGLIARYVEHVVLGKDVESLGKELAAGLSSPHGAAHSSRLLASIRWVHERLRRRRR